MTLLDSLSGLASTVLRPARRAAGPLHRRRPTFVEEPYGGLQPLPPPWDDPRWFPKGFPPHQHNALRLLIHGDEYFADLFEALRSAQKRVTIAGWCLTPLIPLLRGDGEKESQLADVLREVSERAEVYVLLWAGSPVFFPPTQHMTAEVRKALSHSAPRVRCELDNRAPFSHDHHQKAVTVDGRIAYIGGMDLTTFQGDRWDTCEHSLRFGPNWHDVQVRIDGEAAQDVEQNFCERWNSVTGDRLTPVSAPSADPSWQTPAQIIRTIPEGFYPFAPKGEFGIYYSLTTAIRQAKHFVYLENQYIWCPEIIDALAAAMEAPRDGPFRIVVILPAKAEMGRYDNDEHVRDLTNLDAGRGMFHAYTHWSGGAAAGTTGFQYEPVYVHAKVNIVDDEWFSVGSANLNRRGVRTDTEMNVQSIAPDVARSLRIRLWAEHLIIPEEEIANTDPITLVDHAWPDTARRVEDAIRAGSFPPNGHARVYVPGRNPGSRVLDLLQTETLEH